MDIGERIKKRRKELGLSAEQIAENSEYHQQLFIGMNRTIS